MECLLAPLSDITVTTLGCMGEGYGVPRAACSKNACRLHAACFVLTARYAPEVAPLPKAV